MKMVSKRLPGIHLLLIAIVFFILAGCGSKQSPTGGKADTDKLRLLASLPEEFAEVDQQKIELTFNKSVDQPSFLTGMYIYPPVQNKKIYYESNVITVKFLEALLRDTNYYLTLTTRIKDSRGNALDKNQTLIFRHGVLQNSRISGNISYEKPADNGLPIQLNLVSPDSLWVATRQVSGQSYALEGLNPLAYTLRAYIDKNLNGRYDMEQEPYFEGKTLLQQVSNINFNLVYADTVLPRIKAVKAISNREYEISLNKPIATFQSITLENMSTRSNIRIFTINHEQDKINLLTAETDSSDLKFIITGLKDGKGNISKKSSLTIAASTKADLTPPRVISSNPRNGSSVADLQPVLEVVFSEVVPVSNFKASLLEVESRRVIPFRVLQSNSTRYQIQPEKPLANYKTCLLTIEETTTDLSGNNLKPAYKFAFLPIQRK
jgi:hypothetical protein